MSNSTTPWTVACTLLCGTSPVRILGWLPCPLSLGVLQNKFETCLYSLFWLCAMNAGNALHVIVYKSNSFRCLNNMPLLNWADGPVSSVKDSQHRLSRWSVVKNLPLQDTQVWSSSGEDLTATEQLNPCTTTMEPIAVKPRNFPLLNHWAACRNHWSLCV